MEEDEVALSDVHLNPGRRSKSADAVKPQRDYEVHASEFRFHMLGEGALSPEADDDGDLVVKRRRLTEETANSHTIVIEHTLATRIKDVGLQVWSGCLLLCDFIVWKSCDLEHKLCLELGAGVGLASVLLLAFSRKVFTTDIGIEVLKTCRANLERNKRLLSPKRDRAAREKPDGDVCVSGRRAVVKELDWLSGNFITGGEFGWSVEEISELQDLDLVFAADVIYDDRLTDALVGTLKRLCARAVGEIKVYIAIEKRLNFTLSQLNVACPAYEYFMDQLENLMAFEPVEESKDKREYEVHKLPLDFPQCFQYDRHKYLELWEIVARPRPQT